MDETELEALAEARAAQQGCELSIAESDGEWEASYQQDSPMEPGSSVTLKSSGPSPSRYEALSRLIEIDDIMAHAGEH